PPPLPPRFAFVRTPVWDKADGDTKAAFEELAATLGSAIEPVDLPPSWAEAWEVHRTIMATEMAHNLAPLVARAEPSEALRKLLPHGRGVSAVDYLGALAKAERYAAGLSDIFDAYDAIVTPAAPGVAPKGLGSTGDPAFCTLWTLSGLPAVSLPLFAGEGGLPLGAQLVGPRGRDGRLLRTATALTEPLAPNKKRPPPPRPGRPGNSSPGHGGLPSVLGESGPPFPRPPSAARPSFPRRRRAFGSRRDRPPPCCSARRRCRC